MEKLAAVQADNSHLENRKYLESRSGHEHKGGLAMLDKKAHIKRKGGSCPLCGSPSIQGGFVEIETGKAFQKMTCADCEVKWQDIYELIDVRICHEH